VRIAALVGDPRQLCEVLAADILVHRRPMSDIFGVIREHEIVG
jgi:hypothetical protein